MPQYILMDLSLNSTNNPSCAILQLLQSGGRIMLCRILLHQQGVTVISANAGTSLKNKGIVGNVRCPYRNEPTFVQCEHEKSEKINYFWPKVNILMASQH